jgi:hypothetical protein
MKSLPEREQDNIHCYYKEMLYAFHDGRKQMAQSYMLTLLNGGYLIDSRDERLNQLLEEDEQL